MFGIIAKWATIKIIRRFRIFPATIWAHRCEDRISGWSRKKHILSSSWWLATCVLPLFEDGSIFFALEGQSQWHFATDAALILDRFHRHVSFVNSFLCETSTWVLMSGTWIMKVELFCHVRMRILDTYWFQGYLFSLFSALLRHTHTLNFTLLYILPMPKQNQLSLLVRFFMNDSAGILNLIAITL